MERNQAGLSLQWHEQTFYENINSRREFLRVTVDSKGILQLYGEQNSQILSSICFCDGLIEVAPKQIIEVGDNVKFYNFSSIG